MDKPGIIKKDMAKRKNIVDNNNSNEGEKTKEMLAADLRAENELRWARNELLTALAQLREVRAQVREYRAHMKARTMEDIEVVGVLSVGDGDGCGGRGGDGSVGDGGGDGEGSGGDGGGDGDGDGDGSGGDGGGSGGDGDGSGGDGDGSGGYGGGSGGDCDGDNEGCDKTEGGGGGGGKMGTKMEPKGQHDNRNRFSYHGGDENGYPVGQLDRCNYQAAMAVAVMAAEAAVMATAIMMVGIKLKAVAIEKWIPKRVGGQLHRCYYEKPNVCSIIPYQVLV